jgi:HAD superfamily hydrolase (TIGR01509 family)
MMPKCILFDNDGTLVDSEPLCFRALAIKFSELGVELDEHALLIELRGWKLTTLLEKLTEKYDVLLGENFIPSYRKVVAGLFSKELKTTPGVVAALEQINIPKAVVSSGPMAKIVQALQVTDIAHHFGSNIYSSYDVGVWKPDPAIYQYAARDMGFSTGECVVVDDSPVGVEAGARAGIKTFYYNRFNEPCELEGVTSFTSMSELPGLIFWSLQ